MNVTMPTSLLYLPDSWNLIHMEIFSDTFYQEVMVGNLSKTGNDHRADHADFLDADGKRAAKGQ